MLGNARGNAEAMPKICFGGILGNAKGNFFRASWEGILPGNPGRKARGTGDAGDAGEPGQGDKLLKPPGLLVK